MIGAAGAGRRCRLSWRLNDSSPAGHRPNASHPAAAYDSSLNRRVRDTGDRGRT